MINKKYILTLIKEEFNKLLIEFPVLGTDIPIWQQERVKKLHGKLGTTLLKNEYEKSQIIPDAKIQLSPEDKALVLQSLFHFNISALEAKLTNFKAYLKTDPQFIEDFKASIIEGKYDINIKTPWITDIYMLYRNIFYNVSSKMSIETGKLFLSKNQLVNFNKWFESYKRYRNITVDNPFLDGAFTQVNSIVAKDKDFDINLFSEQPMYLYVSGKAEDILNMAISKFFDSCQNIIKGSHNKQVLANVFDEDMKIAYLIFDAEFVDFKSHKHSVTPLARMIMRVAENPRTKEKGLVYTRVYPDNMQKVFFEILKKYGYKNTRITNLELKLFLTPTAGEAEKLSNPYVDTYQASAYTFIKGVPQSVYNKIRSDEKLQSQLLSDKTLDYNGIKIKPIKSNLATIFGPLMDSLDEKKMAVLLEKEPSIIVAKSNLAASDLNLIANIYKFSDALKDDVKLNATISNVIIGFLKSALAGITSKQIDQLASTSNNLLSKKYFLLLAKAVPSLARSKHLPKAEKVLKGTKAVAKPSAKAKSLKKK